MKLMEFAATSFGSHNKVRVIINLDHISMITPTPGSELFSTTIWLMGGLEQAVEGHIDVIASRLAAKLPQIEDLFP